MQIETFKADNHYVVVEQIKESETVMDSGLVLLEKLTWNDLMCGTVKALSDNVSLPNIVTVDTKVHFFEKDVKCRFYLDGKEYLSLKDMDLLAFRDM